MAARILVFAGSIRTGALSGKTADAAMKELAEQGAEISRISLGDYPLPILNQDLEAEEGIPDNAYRLGRQIAAHDGMLVASPEYNSSIPPLLKNCLDWVSRIRKEAGKPFAPFEGKVAALCSSSDGAFAGVRGLYHLRSVLLHCKVEVITPQLSVPRAQEAFEEDGSLKDDHLRKSLGKVCRTLIERAQMLSTRTQL
ncbi:FMN reductase [Mesorhizobium sp. NBSH29]|uniref:NADPH-dependent FMN reductase n=1 Tax=Mesorhizobium sp. NBSH29 TaxID=2654249 RepID=UPI0018969A2E|nr:NAD(P)H-dependent oxidoreductase [Mesorhizobium sp. NBSH29]QPC86125.1 FMN reductase [Mesorhizobium sp. NBSH29]